MNWTAKLTLGLALLLTSYATGATAQSNTHIYRSSSGDTTFSAAAEGSCSGRVVRYNTRYQGTPYQGNLWVKSPTGQACEGGRGRTLSGYFEERGDRNTWCRGQLTVYLTQDPRGGSYARWNQISAVPGYACSGAGTTPSIPLYYRPR